MYVDELCKRGQSVFHVVASQHGPLCYSMNVCLDSTIQVHTLGLGGSLEAVGALERAILRIL